MLKGATVRMCNPQKTPSHNPLLHFKATVPTAGASLLPNAHISTNRNSATNRQCGHPVFSEQAQKSANWPSNGLFLPCVEFRWTGREERCRKCNMESWRGKFPLNAAVCHVCVSFWVRVVHKLMFMCICGCVCVLYTVTKCGWAFTVCVYCV